MLDSVFGNVGAQIFELRCGVERGAGDKVIDREVNLLAVENPLDLHLFQLSKGRGGDVVANHGVHLCGYNLAR